MTDLAIYRESLAESINLALEGSGIEAYDVAVHNETGGEFTGRAIVAGVQYGFIGYTDDDRDGVDWQVLHGDDFEPIDRLPLILLSHLADLATQLDEILLDANSADACPSWAPDRDCYVVATETDMDFGYHYECDQYGIPRPVTKNGYPVSGPMGPIIGEAYLNDTTLDEARALAQRLRGRYGRTAIARLEWVERDV